MQMKKLAHENKLKKSLETSKEKFIKVDKERIISMNKCDRVQTSDGFWRSVRVLVIESSFRQHSFMSLVLFCSNSAQFSKIKLLCNGRMDGRTDRRTDRRTDLL